MKEHAVEEAREDRAAAEPARTAAATATGAVAEVLSPQRSIGNRGTTRVLGRQGGGTATARTTEDLASSGDAAAIAAAGNLEESTQDQRLRMLRTLAAVARPNRAMRRAMEVLWAGLGAHFHAREPQLYRACARAGARMPRWMPIDDWRTISEMRPGVVTEHQVSRMKPAMDRLSVDDYISFRGLVEYEGEGFTDTHRAFLYKALAARRSISDIRGLWWAIWLRDTNWLLRNLAVTDQQVAVGSTAAGIAQQWQMSCGPTTVQTVRAQTDPIYALSLRQGGDITVQNQSNAPLTNEQATILQGHGSTPTPIGTAGGGAWVETNLNALRNTTGLRYTFVRVIAKTAAAGGNPAKGAVDRAWTKITEYLDEGKLVPLLIGGAPGGNDHYVSALRRDGDRILVNDSGNATTGWVTKAQVMGNNMSPPLSWPLLQGYDRPST